MGVSPVSTPHPPLARTAELAEGVGPDHDGDGDDSAAAVRPVVGQPAAGGGIYL